MSMTPTKLTDRDAEFAALLGHKQTESTWKPTLFLIARFREESERLALQLRREESQQARDLVAKMVLDTTKELTATAGSSTLTLATAPKPDDSVIWTMLYAGLAPVYGGGLDSVQKIAHGTDEALREYKARFGNG